MLDRPGYARRSTLFLAAALSAGGAAQGQYERDTGSAPRESFQWPEGKKAAISLTFDDGRPSQLDHGIPVLSRHGARATFYVNPGPVSSRVADWRKVKTAGHEIGNHSMNHPCTGNFAWARDKALEDFSWQDMVREVEAANDAIEDLLGLKPRTFAYPCGQKFIGRGRQLRSYVPLIATEFLAGRGWLDEGPNDPAFCDFAQLLGMELDGLSFEQARELMDQAASGGMWLIFCGHDVGVSGRQTVRIPTLDAICRYAMDPANGLWIDTVERVTTYIRAQRND